MMPTLDAALLSSSRAGTDLGRLSMLTLQTFNFSPIPWQAAEIIGGLLATELQTPMGTQYTGGQNFFVPDFN